MKIKKNLEVLISYQDFDKILLKFENDKFFHDKLIEIKKLALVRRDNRNKVIINRIAINKNKSMQKLLKAFVVLQNDNIEINNITKLSIVTGLHFVTVKKYLEEAIKQFYSVSNTNYSRIELNSRKTKCLNSLVSSMFKLAKFGQDYNDIKILSNFSNVNLETTQKYYEEALKIYDKKLSSK